MSQLYANELVLKLARDIPYGSSVTNFVLKLDKELQAVLTFDERRVLRVRNQLNSYAISLPNKKKQYVQGVLYVLKGIYKEKGSNPDIYKTYKRHKLTDHAFCRGLERFYNVNVDELKDRMMAELDSNPKAIPLTKNGAIVTYLQREA